MMLTPTEIESMAKEIRSYLLDHNYWIDTTIYFNRKAYSTDNRKGNFSYNDRENLIELENENPRDYFEYVNDILSMSFEGPLCHALYYGTNRKVASGLEAIFKKYGCYYEFGDHWNLTLFYEK